MTIPTPSRRSLGLVALLLPLLGLLVHVALRSGPLAPVAVTLVRVEQRALQPALFGIGQVEARHRYRIGPTQPGRLATLSVRVGERVTAGQLLARMDPVDLEARILAQQAALQQNAARQREARAQLDYAERQRQRYQLLQQQQAVSAEQLLDRQHEAALAAAGLAAALAEQQRLQADLQALRAQQHHLELRAPVDALVVRRDTDPGSTLVAGQTVLELIDPNSLRLEVRFDQLHAGGLQAGLAARIALRSRPQQELAGLVLRQEPLADAITEELLAKVGFAPLPPTLPAIGELAEVTVLLPPLEPTPVIPQAALQRQGGQTGVWQKRQGKASFVPVITGASDLDGFVQVTQGVRAGDELVLYSAKALRPGSRLRPVAQLTAALRP